MAQINQKTSSSDGDHYYDIQGRPAYGVRIPKVREMGYLPSPSTILKVMSKPGINIWFNQIVAETALEMADELKANFAGDLKEAGKQAVVAAQEKGKEAMDLGTRIHSQAEDILEGKDPVLGDPYSVGIADYCTMNVIRTEWVERNVRHVSSDIAYAGRVDALVEHQAVGLAVLDWKSSKVVRTKKNKPQPKFYDPYIMQLACYARAIEGSPQPISVGIDTKPGFEGGVYEKIWSDEEWSRGWRMFVLLYRLWCEDKKYWPHKFWANNELPKMYYEEDD